MKKKIIFIAVIFILFIFIINIAKTTTKPNIPIQSDIEKIPIENINEIPDEADIVFTSSEHILNKEPPTREIYVMDLDTRKTARVTYSDGKRSYSHAVVSPDKKKIVTLIVDKDTNKDGKLAGPGEGGSDHQTLWVIDIENKLQWKLIPKEKHVTQAEWSPDGSKILTAISFNKRALTDLFVLTPEGKIASRLTNTIDSAEGDADWSFDGKMVSFIRIQKGELKSQVWVMDSDGTGQRKITDGGDLPGGTHGPFPIGDYDPEISPDNKKVVFGRLLDPKPNYGCGRHNFFVADIESKEVYNLSNSNGCEVMADWSYDGKQIIFNVFDVENNYGGLVLLNSDGTKRTILQPELIGKRIGIGGQLVRWIPKIKK